MPPKITDSRPNPEAVHTVEEQTAAGARSVVATYAEDLTDGVTLMCMLGVEPEGLNYKKVHEEHLEATAPKTAKRTRKSTKKAAKKTTKKTKAKKTTKKTTAKKATAKKTTAKKTAKKA